MRIEIHGKKRCPYAWRVRLAAREKGVDYDWIAWDVPDADSRAFEHNPERKSPLMVHGDFRLRESAVIAQYIDEAFDGPALQPRNPRERALMRLDLLEVRIELEPTEGEPRKLAREADAAWESLERHLADGRPWLGGDRPLLVDLLNWPFMYGLQRGGHPVPERLGLAMEYWKRAARRESFVASRP